MFSALGLVFGGTEGVVYSFLFLRSRTRFPRYRGRGVSFSCFVARTQFQRYRGRRVPFSCFALPDTFSAVSSASGLVFMFCTPVLIVGGDECVGSRFHVLSSRTNFRWYRGRRVPFSCFVRPDTFSAVPRALSPVFKFCTSELIFGGTEGVGSLFQVLHSQTRIRRYRGCRVPFSCFAPPNSFSAVPSVSGPVFMFRASRLVFGGTEGVGSHFHVLRSRTRFGRY
jgi:hypothetical protein